MMISRPSAPKSSLNCPVPAVHHSQQWVVLSLSDLSASGHKKASVPQRNIIDKHCNCWSLTGPRQTVLGDR